MADLLTTRQLQDLLQIDRITVYRMLNDGRLKGVKIGNQWRFPQSEIDRLLGEERAPVEPAEAAQVLSDFPADCVGKVQDIFAGIIGVGAVTITLEGEPLTEPTYCNPFCRLMLANPSGHKACQASWRKIALRNSGDAPFQVCHAGLHYRRATIDLDQRPVAYLVAGQFYAHTPEREQQHARLAMLAARHQIPLERLEEAAERIPILKNYQQEQVREWTPRVASTVHSILCERAELMDRLQRIAELSTVRPALPK
jgi:excisionase family DNA binding protein